MSIGKEDLRKEVGKELSEALRFAERAANLLRHYYITDSGVGCARQDIEALARIVASVGDNVNGLLDGGKK